MPFFLAYITGTKAPDWHLVALPLSHTERPKYKEAETANFFLMRPCCIVVLAVLHRRLLERTSNGQNGQKCNEAKGNI